jgi:hypothetical protein
MLSRAAGRAAYLGSRWCVPLSNNLSLAIPGLSNLRSPVRQKHFAGLVAGLCNRLGL